MRGHLDAAEQALPSGHGGVLAKGLRLAQRALSAVTGEFTSDELLGRIFSEFCIGK